MRARASNCRVSLFVRGRPNGGPCGHLRASKTPVIGMCLSRFAPSAPAPVEVHMERYARSHLANQTLLDSLATHLAQNRGSTAELLADLAEIDERKLYRPAG